MEAEDPHTSEGSGGADASNGVQGQRPVGGAGGEVPRKQNEYNVLTMPKIAFLYLFSVSFEVDG